MTAAELHERSNSICELCTGTANLQIYEVLPASKGRNGEILICDVCSKELAGPTKLDSNHWRCLNNSMWSEIQPVQVMAWRLLNKLVTQGDAWAQGLLDMLYLDEDTLAWANAEDNAKNASEEKVIHKDSNGTVLQTGDTVVLIKDLDVKGGGFTAKRGTAVRGIVLAENNAGQIEGRINGQQIVILTQYVKKST